MTLISGRGSGLNPNARPFIPAVYRQVEDFSPEWWNLVQSSAWFRDYWMAERQDASFEDPEDDDIKNLLPETFDVGYDEFPYADDEFNEFIGSVDNHGSGYGFRPEAKTTKAPGLDGGTLMKNLNLSSLSPKGSGRGTTANYLMEQTKYNERHAQRTSYNHGGRRIHQPR